jgi:hypothetical protein
MARGGFKCVKVLARKSEVKTIQWGYRQKT